MLQAIMQSLGVSWSTMPGAPTKSPIPQMIPSRKATVLPAGIEQDVRTFVTSVLILTEILAEEGPEEYRNLCRFIQKDAVRMRAALTVE